MLCNYYEFICKAHCVEGGTSGTIILGAHFLSNPNEPHQRRIAISNAFGYRLHPGWDPSAIRNDVALVQLPEPIEFNQFIRPVILPTVNQLNHDFSGELGVVSGWGRFSDDLPQSSDVLRFVYDNIITNGICTIRFPG